MREIVLDTETTGLNPLLGDRVVEIGCVALENHLTTGETFHVYINPERDVPEEAARVHGLRNDFLADKPVFTQIVDDFLTFIGDAPLVIHNASFDMGFLNAELTRAGYKTMGADRAIDTLMIARKKYPGSPATLDALCKRFSVDLSARTLHGALLDAQLLAEVYLELRGGRQPGLDMAAQAAEKSNETAIVKRIRREARLFDIPETDLQEHQAFLEKIKKPLWTREDAV